VQATAYAYRTGEFVTSYSVVEPGIGYTSAPNVSVVGGGGSGATAHALVSGGSVTSVVADLAGSGYTNDPTVIIDPPPADIEYVTYWSNDGSGPDGSQPSNAVPLTVTKGLYSVLLGDDTLANMQAISSYVFMNDPVYLRVWFNDGAHGFQRMLPDRRIAAVGYALNADLSLYAADADALDGLDSGYFASQTDLSTHSSAPSAHHARYADAEAVSAILAADGPGSALDADLLDGQHGSNFVEQADFVSHESTASAHHPRYSNPEAVSAILAADGDGSTLDADLLDGQDSSDFVPAHTQAIFRWNVWSTYGQAHGQWYGNNDSDMFGGVNPSNWGDGNGMAHQMSTNMIILRTLFNRKCYAGKNAMVYADEWYSYSSTNSKQVGALMRIRNTTGSAINWTPYWYRTAYGGWSERASIAINGVHVWDSGGSNYGPGHNSSHTFAVPADQISTVIFIAASSSDSGTRSCFMAFYNDCLELPAGLEWVDDLDTGSW